MKKIISVLVMMAMVFAFTACGSGGDSGESSEPVTYESILEEYTQKIEEATPRLIDEYNEEAAELSGDINALAELSNSKLEELAKIETEGIEKMADLMLENGDEQEVYEEWAEKLYDVYAEYSGQITDAYMDSAM